jgi:uncharacterized protein (TIGR02145 family)
MKKSIFLFLTLFTLLACKKEDSTVPPDTSGISTISDNEGNVYKTLKIGTQTWMTENLRVEKYNDGTDIPLVTDSTEWIQLDTDAYCYYANDEAKYKTKYGALYNGYAVNSGKLAPTGWHVATYDDWQTLLDYLIAQGYNFDGTTVANKVAIAMSAYDDWYYSTGMGCPGNDDYLSLYNKSGFSAMPAGSRLGGSYIFSFMGAHMTTGWRTSTPYTGAFYAVGIRGDNPSANIFLTDYRSGLSVRCVKDE